MSRQNKDQIKPLLEFLETLYPSDLNTALRLTIDALVESDQRRKELESRVHYLELKMGKLNNLLRVINPE